MSAGGERTEMAWYCPTHDQRRDLCRREDVAACSDPGCVFCKPGGCEWWGQAEAEQREAGA